MEIKNELEVIASLTKVIQDNADADQLASHLAHRVLGHLDCRAVAIGVIQKEGFLDLIGHYGLSEKTTEPFVRMKLWSHLPMTEAARTGEFIYLKSDKEILERYPNMMGAIEHKDLITVASPIFHRNAIIGSIAFSSIKAPQDNFKSSPLTEIVLSLVGIYVKNFIDKRSQTTRSHANALSGLSERQKQIIKLFREELTTEQMANRLRFSPSTIKQDIIKIYDLFGVSSREEVVALAERAGLIEPEKAN